MAQKIIITHTANCRDRTEDIRYIILHCSSYSPDKQLDILDKYGLSTHYIVSERGQITENCPPDKVAYHAGESSWLGSEGKSLNGCSIGIELESFNLGQTPQDYSSAQISAALSAFKAVGFCLPYPPREHSWPFRHRTETQSRPRRRLSLAKALCPPARPLAEPEKPLSRSPGRGAAANHRLRYKRPDCRPLCVLPPFLPPRSRRPHRRAQPFG